MIDEAATAEIRRLVLGEGWRIGTVARHLGIHHTVVRRVLRGDQPPTKRPAAVSCVEPFKAYILDRLTRYPELSATRLFQEIRERGYDRSLPTLKRFVQQVRGPRAKKAYLHVHVAPGEQAQVDWGSFGLLRASDTRRPLSCFVMVLSWSRAMFLDFCLDQSLETFCAMHQRAFDFFGGVPQTLLYDNLKTVVLHHVGSVIQFNPRFLAFAGQYLFEPRAAPNYYPEAKGRVESGIRYVRRSFFYGRSFSSLDDLRAQAARWRDEVSNTRIHASTRERPIDRLLQERPRLRPVPHAVAPVDRVIPVIVAKDASVRFETNSYSVPHRLVGQSALLRVDHDAVRVLAGDVEVARHPRCWDRRQHVVDPVHRADLAARRPGASGSQRLDRLARLAPECRAYLHEIARRRIQLDNEIRKLLRLLDRYGQDDFIEGVRRALVQRNFGARYVRTLIDQIRFARGLGEPPELVTTGLSAIDALVVEPHRLETYDALFQVPQVRQAAVPQEPATTQPRPANAAPCAAADEARDPPSGRRDPGHGAG